MKIWVTVIPFGRIEQCRMDIAFEQPTPSAQRRPSPNGISSHSIASFGVAVTRVHAGNNGLAPVRPLSALPLK
jgi:hypothetical protein